jgi:hypothetical protein
LQVLRLAAAQGAVPREEAEALARDWLALTGADVAMRVLTGGTHEAAQLVELCSFVLRTLGVSAEPERASEGGGR